MWPNKALLERDLWRTDILLWVSFGFVHVSPAVSSIALGLFVLQLILVGDTVPMKGVQRWALFLMAMALCWNMLSLWDSAHGGLVTQSFVTDKAAADLQKMALGKLLIKLPWMIVLGLYAAGRRLNTVLYRAWPVVVLPLLWIAVSSVIHYLQHRAFYDQMVLESKPIPLYSNVYHIEFAVMMGGAVLLMLHGLMHAKVKDELSRKLLGASVIVLVVCMHILGSRTGLILLYTGGAAMTGLYLKSQTKQLLKVALVGLLLLGGLILLPSVQNRIANTMEDLRTTERGGDVTHQSFGQRWIAWNTTVAQLKAPTAVISGFGVGTDDVLREAYDRLSVRLAERHRIGVHNQWLEGSMQSGWMSFLALLMLGFFAFGDGSKVDRISGRSIWFALLIAMMFESLMERQAGILVLIVVFQGLMQEKNGSNSEIKTEYALNDENK
ncbi:MAG: hypothetical protein RJA00_85 [Bacteroidota bacterium]